MKYLLGLGADTEAADVGTRYVTVDEYFHDDMIAELILSNRKPADLAILKSFGADSTRLEHDIVEVFSQKDDYISDFEFTPIHIAVLDIYQSTDLERPTLEQ